MTSGNLVEDQNVHTIRRTEWNSIQFYQTARRHHAADSNLHIYAVI